MSVDRHGRVVWMAQNSEREVAMTSNSVLSPDEWVHVAGTYDGGNMRVFINGELDSEKPVVGVNPQGEPPLYVGTISGGTPPYFRGTIQAIRISNVALTKFDLP